jgi:hypothetical protein
MLLLLAGVVSGLTAGLAQTEGLGRGYLGVELSWKNPVGTAQVEMERQVDEHPSREQWLPSGDVSQTRMNLPLEVQHRVRVRATTAAGDTSEWTQLLFTLKQDKETSASLMWKGDWRREQWKGWHNWGSADQFIRVASSGASVVYSFMGTSVQWIADRGPEMGSAEVFLDGKSVGQISLKSSKERYGQAVYSAQALAAGMPHRLEIRVLAGGSVNVHSFAVFSAR